ncbi:hypothetical protein GOV12_02685, partial [Candidatus Pacearchaeota archaeon]|nr:hypothetical protein [Candidatus Pacearchaeota archaeon]
GGSIWILANNITGAGILNASGGFSSSSTSGHGAGGGGRIALTSSNVIEFSGMIDNKGGISDAGSPQNDFGTGGTVYINATNSVTMSGNISIVGYNGSSGGDRGQRINFTSDLIILSGVYNASAVNPSESGVNNGTIFVSYESGGSSFVGAIFDPYANYTIILPDISYSEFSGKGESTDLDTPDLSSNTVVSGLVLDDGADGIIEFTQDVTLNDSYDLDSNIDISPGSIYVNDTYFNGALNKSANLTFRGLVQYGYPQILKDGAVCTDCTILSWDSALGEIRFNVTGFSNYTATEANQSKVQNNGTYNISFYLLMKTQAFSGGAWVDEDIVINDSATDTKRMVDVDNLTKLDLIWNEQLYNSSNLSNGNGTYRVVVALQDNIGNVMNDSEGNYLNASFNFTLDGGVPYSVELDYPADDQLFANTANNITFNWTVMDDYDLNLTCNLTIDDSVNKSGIISQNGTTTSTLINNIAVGDHEWNVTCWDDSLNVNSSVSYNVSVFTSFPPTDPVISVINSSDGTNKTLANVSCFTTLIDPEGNTTNVSVRWYKNATLDFTLTYNNSYSNGTYFNSTMNSGNTTRLDNWSCSIRLDSDGMFSNWSNSPNITIINSAPNITYQSDNYVGTNRTPVINYSVSDDDGTQVGEIVNYEINISLNAFSVCSDTRSIITETDPNYTIGPLLKCLDDNGDTYNWSVRAFDGINYSEWSGRKNFTINSEIIIGLPVSTINFGGMLPDTLENTSDDSPLPFIVNNSGNVLINITGNFSNIWNSSVAQNPSHYYQFKARNQSSSCMDYSNSVTDWTNATTTNISIIQKLNFTSGFQNGCNNVSIDIQVLVPNKELPLNRSSTIVFMGEMGELYSAA